ncbi:hypothetical protein ACLOJK_003971 [Asimina triloba]
MKATNPRKVSHQVLSHLFPSPYARFLFVVLVTCPYFSHHSHRPSNTASTELCFYPSDRDFLGTIVEIAPIQIVEITLPLSDSISQQIDYLNSLNDNITTLMGEINELQRKHDEVEAVTEAAASVGRKRLSHAENWLMYAARIVPEVDSVKLELDQGANLCSLCNLGKRVMEKIEDIKRLQEKRVFDKIAGSPCFLLMQVMQVPAQLEQQGNCEEQRLAQALSDSDEEIGIVCIYGMDGIGKVTVIKVIYKIGNKFDMEFDDNEVMEENKDDVYARLRNVRYMLSLDDL